VEHISKRRQGKKGEKWNLIMRHTESKSQIDIQKIVIFGAGKIGRSFIGQLFGRSGYKIVFVDVDPVIISLLNTRNSYRVVIKGEKEEEIIVRQVQAISALDKQSVIDTVSTAGIAAVSVGKNALEKVLPLIASGLKKRFNDNPNKPLDIILAENMRSAADFTREQLVKNLSTGFPVDSYVGLIETSIGKMVPIIPQAEVEKDPLVVFAEPYNTLILDGKGFKSPIPDVRGLAPKNNIKAWVDRKAFIHNLGHATAAYLGYFKHPDAVYMYEVLDDENILQFTRNVMLQSAEILRVVYPGDYTKADLEEHIDDLLYRFRNKVLQDTIFRVGQDLPRKLGADDRFMGSIHLALQNNMPYDMIIKAMSYGFFFRARDEEGSLFPADKAFHEALSADFESALIKLLFFDPVNDSKIITDLKRLFISLKDENKK
jgi:mannitol-1-phosphate 5-dehydrogenase